jgi:integration host factor subunit alpha
MSTVNRETLANAIHEEMGVSHPEASKMVDAVFDIMARGLVQDGVLKISDFASFNVHQKKERMGRNLKTGESVPIPARKTVLYKPAKKVRLRCRDC